MATTSEDVWRILAELATAQAELTAAQKETDKQLKEVSQQQKENAQQQKETERRQQETDRQLRELGKQIGGLGAKFGSFTEGLALPSMETILRQRFGMEVVSPSVRVSKDGQHLEIDVLAYTNGEKFCKKGFMWLGFMTKYLNSIFLIIFNLKSIKTSKVIAFALIL